MLLALQHATLKLSKIASGREDRKLLRRVLDGRGLASEGAQGTAQFLILHSRPIFVLHQTNLHIRLKVSGKGRSFAVSLTESFSLMLSLTESFSRMPLSFAVSLDSRLLLTSHPCISSMRWSPFAVLFVISV